MSLPKSFRDLPLDQIGAQQVFEVLDPIWERTPETGSRLRGRIAAVINSTRGPEDERRNPAAWTKWLKEKLGEPKKLGKIDRLTGERVARSNHAAMSYKLVPALMAKLAGHAGARGAGVADRHPDRDPHHRDARHDVRRDRFRGGHMVHPTEPNEDGQGSRVPLSPPALAILRALAAERGDSFNRHVFPGRPMSSLAI